MIIQNYLNFIDKFDCPPIFMYTLVKAKPDLTENVLLIKNRLFLSNHDETLAK